MTPQKVIVLKTNPVWTGIVVDDIDGMVEVDWLTGPCAGERKWADSDAVTAAADSMRAA